MLSVKKLNHFISPLDLKNLSQSLAVLDAIISPNWAYRYYSFNSKWGNNEQMASMRNGQGGSLFILFCDAGTIIKGFTNTSLSRLEKADLAVIPSEFTHFINEPAFVIEEASFILWRKNSESNWNKLNKDQDDGSQELLSIYDQNPERYKFWADSYFEKKLPLQPIQDIYKLKSITQELVLELNHAYPIDTLEKELDEIGYTAVSST